jgi:hypothetical protein
MAPAGTQVVDQIFDLRQGLAGPPPIFAVAVASVAGGSRTPIVRTANMSKRWPYFARVWRCPT